MRLSTTTFTDEAALDHRLREYWSWMAVALFLLITVDLLTSLYAVAVVGLEHEANPLMVWLLAQPLPLVVGIHIIAGVLASVLFYGIIELIRETRPTVRPVIMHSLEVYLGLLVAAGLFVFANNLSVIVLGESLL